MMLNSVKVQRQPNAWTEIFPLLHDISRPKSNQPEYPASSANNEPLRRIMLLATRDPRGRLTGRKLVLRTIIESISHLGHELMVAHFGPAQSDEEYKGVRFVPLDGPYARELAEGVAQWLLRGNLSLNEALYRSSRAQRRITDLITEFQPDLVVSDMVRTARYAQCAGIPWIADLDDLLSERYRRAASTGDGYDYLLGYHGGLFLRILLRLSAPARRFILRREASVLLRRECEIARSASLVSLVNGAEAETLSLRTGVPVANIPMAIRPPAKADGNDDARSGFVFVGPLDYAPNRHAVMMYDTRIAPRLRDLGMKNRVLHVIGKCTNKDREAFSDAVVCHGYVDELDTALCRFEYMLIPEVAPGGVKTKIIHAMLNRLVVLAHNTAIYGTNLEPYRHLLVWNDETELRDIIRQLDAGDIEKDALRENAYRWAHENFRPEIIRQKWRTSINTCLPEGH